MSTHPTFDTLSRDEKTEVCDALARLDTQLFISHNIAPGIDTLSCVLLEQMAVYVITRKAQGNTRDFAKLPIVVQIDLQQKINEEHDS